MVSENCGTVSVGVRLPIIRAGDNLAEIVCAEVIKNVVLEDRDIIGITESLVARAQNNYVTVDEIASETDRLFGKNATIIIMEPIYSRNRFSMILKGIARSAKKLIFSCPDIDEVGNVWGFNPWTGVNIKKYYQEICDSENCEFKTFALDDKEIYSLPMLLCNLHHVADASNDEDIFTLMDYFPDKCEYGLLGSNKATEEKVKLFPKKYESVKLVRDIQKSIKLLLNKDVEVMIYGDGCFKDPDSDIWEFADPVTSPAYTDGLEGSPNEIKLKAFADDKYKNLKGKELREAIKEEIKQKKSNLYNSMASQGTTPRRYINLLASLMDLTSGSGDKGTPVVVVKNYFKNYADA